MRPLRPDLLIGDLEREQACLQLSDHYEAGRLTHDEWSDRVSAALAARRSGDLTRVLHDLPRVVPSRPLVPVPPPAPGAVTRNEGLVVFDVLLGLVAVCAAFCLLGLLGLAGGSYSFVAFLGALGGSTVAGALVHFIHRYRRQ